MPSRRSAALAAALVLAACTGDDGGSAPTTTAPVEATPTTRPVTGRADGRYRLGVLVPTEGDRSELGRGVIRGVNLAVAQVNRAGGPAGLPVEVVLRNEPTEPSEAARVVRELIRDERIDALVGPASSSVALATLSQLTAAGVVSCSPTATASELSSFPDGGLFVRTIGSEQAEAVALAEVVQASGESTAALLYADDDYGLAMADAVARALPASISVVGRQAYDPAQRQFQGPARQVLDLEPATVVVVGSGATGAQVLADVVDEATRGTPRVFVSSGLRSRLLTELVAAGSPGVLSGVEGVSPRSAGNSDFQTMLREEDPEAPTAFAAQAYDCVNLLTLAAHLAGGDDGPAAAAQLREVSTLGSPCRDFAGCLDLLRVGRVVDLEGASGPLALDENGDVIVALYEHFRYSSDGRDLNVGAVTVTMGVPVA